jgi:hypothetical protein
MATPYLKILKHHLARNSSSGFVTLASLEDGKPRARTLLFQGLTEEGAVCIKCSSDSNKVSKRSSDDVEIVWWMTDTAVQFRLSGKIKYEAGPSSSDTRRQIWEDLNPAAQGQFFFPKGKLAESLGAPEFEEQRKNYELSQGAIPHNFCVGILCPDEVDFLDLNSCGRQTWTKQADGSWEIVHGYAPPVVSTLTQAR